MRIKIECEHRFEFSVIMEHIEKLKRLIMELWGDADIEVYRVYECRYDECIALG